MYGLLAILSSSKRAKYLFQSRLQLEVASMTALELSKKHSVSTLNMFVANVPLFESYKELLED